MKKLSFIRLLLPVLLVGLALVSCQDNECCDDMGIKEYDMSKSICVNMDGQDYVLLSSSKAAKELFGEDAGSLSEIDFSRYNLLYVQDASPNSILRIQSDWQNGDNDVALFLKVETLLTAEYVEWHKGFLLPKSIGDRFSVEIHYETARQ
ncbi:hypothetical protein [Lepagella muris]|jgi:hypothetical protein|uniref:Uncharacterized protein n=1 Tax=Lepagella muris TaxID=3032870 RepID=A0AC61RLM4_9BACT|nr:hypothetical protein [Lepagella muris]ROT08872.1 hypothetical protein EEL33_04395 [Muribaculaceae bacterium Isolate-037 (Harlan)]TGY80057.1 hypothetical protein E5331_04535 [Lepagella muris]THG53295.1 hypothetical protein E5984_04305 [Bacteroidales bacterium]TKC64819.1 hypothetical protein E5359_001500 [Bacteroidales bacterium]